MSKLYTYVVIGLNPYEKAKLNKPLNVGDVRVCFSCVWMCGCAGVGCAGVFLAVRVCYLEVRGVTLCLIVNSKPLTLYVGCAPLFRGFIRFVRDL